MHTQYATSQKEPVIFTPELLWRRAVEAAEGGYRKLLDSDLSSSYFKLMGVSVEEIHTQPFCLEWSKIIERIVASEVGLFDRNAVIGTSVWLPRNPSDPKNTILQHRFVTAKLTDLDMQILDGTWQQFLPEDARIPGLPRMLVGTIDYVTEQAGRAGVPDALLGMWQEAKLLPTSALYP